jgi:hypothetical protein
MSMCCCVTCTCTPLRSSTADVMHCSANAAASVYCFAVAVTLDRASFVELGDLGSTLKVVVFLKGVAPLRAFSIL